MNNRKKFGEILLELGVITEVDLNNALSRQQVLKKPLGQILEELGIICDTDILQILSRQFNLDRIDEVYSLQVPEQVLKLVDAHTALEHGIFAFGFENGKLLVATSDPLNFSVIDQLAFRVGLHVVTFLATPLEISKAIKKHYLKGASPADNDVPKLLVFDDQGPYRQSLCSNLAKEGYQVLQAETGAEALRKIMRQVPQLILLETDRQRIGGKDLFRTLQSNSLTREIPVIALSACAYPEDEARFLDMGFFDFIAKPYNLVRLRARVRRGLSFSCSRQEA